VVLDFHIRKILILINYNKIRIFLIKRIQVYMNLIVILKEIVQIVVLCKIDQSNLEIKNQIV